MLIVLSISYQLLVVLSFECWRAEAGTEFLLSAARRLRGFELGI
jgi:hypothetical protein